MENIGPTLTSQIRQYAMDRIKILRLQSKVKYYMYMYVHCQTDFANSYILH